MKIFLIRGGGLELEPGSLLISKSISLLLYILSVLNACNRTRGVSGSAVPADVVTCVLSNQMVGAKAFGTNLD